MSTRPLPAACHEILALLREHGPLIPYRLQELTGRAQLTVYRSLKKLQARGLVYKRELDAVRGRSPYEWAIASYPTRPGAPEGPVVTDPNA